MPLLFDIGDAAEVRAALGMRVTEADVPDETIMLDIYAGLAADRVRDWRDALAPSVPDDDPKLRRAAILLSAALIAPSVPHLLAERTPDYQYQQQALPDPTARAVQLEQEAYTAVVSAAGAGSTLVYDVFEVAHGTRGWFGGVITETSVPGVLFW